MIHRRAGGYEKTVRAILNWAVRWGRDSGFEGENLFPRSVCKGFQRSCSSQRLVSLLFHIMWRRFLKRERKKKKPIRVKVIMKFGSKMLL